MTVGNTQGIQLPYASQAANVIPYDVFRMAIDFYPNRCPLLYNLSKLPLNALTFYLNNDTYRPRTTTLGAAYASGCTSTTVADTTGIDVGDILEVDSERILVTAITNGTILATTGAYEGTTAANHNDSSVVTIVTNARTGGEVDQSALSMSPAAVAQYAQTVQHAYQVSGSLQSTGNYMDGQITPLDRDRQMAVQHTMDDMERAMYFGKGAVLSDTVTRQTMKGFQALLTTNNTTSPTNATGYKPSDFVRDTLQACFNNGGQPDTVLVSPFFLTGLSTWGYTLQVVQVGATSLGIHPTVFNVPFLPGVNLIPAPLLAGTGKGTAIAFNSREVRARIKRPLNDYPRGRRGDAVEGDMIFEAALEVENQSHHAWVSGVTGFAIQS